MNEINWKEKQIGKEKNGKPILLGDLQSKLLKMTKDITEVLERNNITYFAEGGTLLGTIRHGGIIPWDDDIDLGFFIKDYKRIINILQRELDSKEYFVQCLETDKDYNVVQPIIKVRLKGTYTCYDVWYDKNRGSHNGIFIDLISYSNISEKYFDNFKYRLPAFLRTLILIILNYLNINFMWLKKRHLKKAFEFDEKFCNSNLVGVAINNIAWKNVSFKKEIFNKFKKRIFSGIEIETNENYDELLTKMYGDYMTEPDIKDIKFMHSKCLRLEDDK